MVPHPELSPVAVDDNSIEKLRRDKMSNVLSTKSDEDELDLGDLVGVQDLQLDGLDPIYQAKVHLLNQAVQDIGMGRYQWFLFCLTGFGWMADNVRLNSFYSPFEQNANNTRKMWEQCIAIILPEITLEFDPKYPNLLGIGQQVGLIVGKEYSTFRSHIIFLTFFSRRVHMEPWLRHYREKACLQLNACNCQYLWYCISWRSLIRRA